MLNKLITFIVLLLLSQFLHGQYLEKQEVDEHKNEYLFFWKQNSDMLINKNLLVNDHSSDAESIDIPVFFNLSTKNFELYSIDSSIVEFDNTAARILCYLSQNSKNSSLVLSLFEHYKYVFEDEMRKNDIPESFAILPFALSSMNIWAESLNGGKGLWQLKYSEASLYGLQVDSIVDERMSVEKSTVAAAKRLKSLFKLYGNWQVCLTAYVCGASNVNNYQNDSIHNNLPQNCSEIVSAFAASKILYDNKSDFGVDSLFKIKNIESDTVLVSQNLHFEQISELMSISIDTLRQLNPEFIKDYIPAGNKQYILRLPVSKKSKFYLLEDSLYNYKKNIFLFTNKIESPPSPNKTIVDRAVVPKNSKLLYYVIKQGDNLGYISEWFNVSQRQLKGWNGISNPRKIRAGKKLKIYIPKGKYSYYSKINNLSFKEKQALVSGKTINKAKKKNNNNIIGGQYLIYTIRRGDSPYSIAKKYPGVSADDIMKWNNISNPSNIRPGEKLKIKKIKR